MTNLRFGAVESASKRKPVEVLSPVERPSEYFGKSIQPTENVQVPVSRSLYQAHRRD